MVVDKGIKYVAIAFLNLKSQDAIPRYVVKKKCYQIFLSDIVFSGTERLAVSAL